LARFLRHSVDYCYHDRAIATVHTINLLNMQHEVAIKLSDQAN